MRTPRHNADWLHPSTHATVRLCSVCGKALSWGRENVLSPFLVMTLMVQSVPISLSVTFASMAVRLIGTPSDPVFWRRGAKMFSGASQAKDCPAVLSTTKAVVTVTVERKARRPIPAGCLPSELSPWGCPPVWPSGPLRRQCRVIRGSFTAMCRASGERPGIPLVGVEQTSGDFDQ